MAEQKIIFLDVDGTLLTYENKLPESAVVAIRQARKKGHKVYICTGRSRAEVPDWLWDIGLDGMIGGNGSYVEHEEKTVMHQLVTPEQCRRIVDWLHERKLEFYLESNNGLFASENFSTAAIEPMKEYTRRKGREVPKDFTIGVAFHGMVFGGELYRDDVNKISYILNTYQDFLDTKEHFPDMQNGTWGGAGEIALFGDLGVKGITKAHAIEELLKYIGADKADTIAFGDAKIDLPMFEYCAYGVAMNSGGDEIKAAADYITDDVDKDGLYKGFKHLGLID